MVLSDVTVIEQHHRLQRQFCNATIATNNFITPFPSLENIPLQLSQPHLHTPLQTTPPQRQTLPKPHLHKPLQTAPAQLQTPCQNTAKTVPP